MVDADVRAVVAAYPSLSDASLLCPKDTLELVQLLHHALRSERPVMARESLHRCVSDCVQRLKHRRLPPHPTAGMHLISYFKEAKDFAAGVELWSWLVNQDTNYVDLRTYGAAIELLAASGQSLSYCEQVYAHGLKRFSEGFSTYHMSPGSLLQSRDQPTALPKTSMTLLQGIVKARLLHGDWVHAYQGLDTALRLHPTQIPVGLFRVFLAERPIAEAYHLFCLLCQAGNLIRPKDLAYLLTDLAAAQGQERASESDLKLPLAVLNAIRIYVGSGQHVNPIHLNTLMHSCLKLLPMHSMSSAKASGESEGLARDLITRLLTTFAVLHVQPVPSTYGVLLKAAGRTRDKVILDEVTASLAELGSRLDTATFTTLLWAVSRSGDAARVESLWISHIREVPPTLEEWFALAKAISLTRNHEFLRSQLESCGNLNGYNSSKIVRTAHTQNLESPSESDPDLDLGISYIPLIHQLISALDAFNDLVLNLEYRNLSTFPPNSMSIYLESQIEEAEWQKKLYDEMTIDPTVIYSRRELTDSPDEKSNQEDGVMTTFMGSTGLELGEIRFRHWKGINELFLLAEVFETRLQKSVHSAIEQGKPASIPRSTNNARSRHDRMSVARSQLLEHRHDMERMRETPLTETEWRQKIIAFRRTTDEDRTEA